MAVGLSSGNWPSGIERVFPDYMETEPIQGDPDVLIEATVEQATPSPSAFAQGLPVMAVQTRGRAHLLSCEEFAGDLVALGDRLRGRFVIRPTAYAITKLLRVCVAQAASRRGVLMLHASGVSVGRNVYLFCGPSGSGKSTIAQELSGPGRAFATDRVVCKRMPSGLWMAHSTPFSDDDGRIGVQPPRRLTAVVFIHKAAETRVCRLPLQTGFLQIVRNVSLVGHDQSSDSELLATVELFASEVPLLSLDFERTENFWELVQLTATSEAESDEHNK